MSAPCHDPEMLEVGVLGGELPQLQALSGSRPEMLATAHKEYCS